MAHAHGTPDLDELRGELQTLGMVVVPFGNEIQILIAAEMIMAAALLYQPGMIANSLGVAFAGLLAFGFHALRYTLAEVEISRVQSVWLELRARHRAKAGSSPAALPAPVMQPTSEGAARTREDSLVRAQPQIHARDDESRHKG